MSTVQPTIYSGPVTPSSLFAGIAHKRGSMWLDSSLQSSDWGRFSIIATDPCSELILDSGTSGRYCDKQGSERLTRESFFHRLDKLADDPHHCAIGFISYEATLPWLGIQPAPSHSVIPMAHFLVYDRVLWYDHSSGEFNDPELVDKWHGDSGTTQGATIGIRRESSQIKESLPKNEYLRRVDRIKHHIREGDIYQANLTCRFDVDSRLDPDIAYMRLRELNPAPYSAYLNFGDYRVLSSSPERMFHLTDDHVQSSPIKGTIERGSPSEERANLHRLLESEKDRAELLMIVDLVRNDLGKVARTGSVRVDNLFRLEIYSSVIHMIADISATIEPGVATSAILKALLPGGSITGAPKKRAAEIITECETTPRSVYTGCIGYVTSGRADFNIAIRTMTHHNGYYHVHAGGGIVADSDPKAEYREMLLKAHNLFRALGAAS